MMHESYESLVNFVQESEKDQFRLLRQLVEQQSFSRFKAGVDAVGKSIANSLRGTGMVLDVVRESELGDQLVFRSPAYRTGVPALLLIGHMDTVYPVDSPFTWFKDDGQKVFGPGVIDMKGGLVTAIFALKALAGCRLLEKVPLTFICNSDEEIGSPASTPLIETEAARSLLGLGFECGGLQGEIVTGRKGKAGYLLSVKGRAGHAAFAGADKASAILELAHKIIALEQLNDARRKIVVNVGVIKGGIGPNTVADAAVAEIDTRFLTAADCADTAAKIARIAADCLVPGTRAELHQTPSRQPMVQSAANRQLFRIISRQAEMLGLPCREELRSGVSDMNTIAEAGIPVVDGMGPVGDCDHCDREYMIRNTLPSRTKLAALSILCSWEHFR
ncbi:M20 family metallopeptidase [Desulfocastanea catecholica]